MEPLFTVELLLIPSLVEFQLVPAVSASLVELVLTRSLLMEFRMLLVPYTSGNGGCRCRLHQFGKCCNCSHQNLGFGVSTGGLIVNFGSTSNGFANNSTNLLYFNGGTATGGLPCFTVHHYFNFFINAGGATITFMGGAGLSASFSITLTSGVAVNPPALVLLRQLSLAATEASQPLAILFGIIQLKLREAPSYEGAF